MSPAIFAKIIPPRVATNHVSRLLLKLCIIMPITSMVAPTRNANLPASIRWSPSRSSRMFSRQTNAENIPKKIINATLIIMSIESFIQNSNGLRKKTRSAIKIIEMKSSLVAVLWFMGNNYFLILKISSIGFLKYRPIFIAKRTEGV